MDESKQDVKMKNPVYLINQISDDPEFQQKYGVYSLEALLKAMYCAHSLLTGRGDCPNCEGQGCSRCDWTGEELGEGNE